MPPATANPSIAAISGLTDARWAMPAKPRSPNQGDSPRTNAPRSMPAQKKPPAPVSTPTERASSESSSSSAPAMPAATAALTALRTSGRSIVMSSVESRRSVVTAEDSSADVVSGASLMGADYLLRLPSRGTTLLSRKQRQLRLALPAQHLDVDLHAVDAMRGRRARAPGA